jgi:hypothetical protein
MASISGRGDNNTIFLSNNTECNEVAQIAKTIPIGEKSMEHPDLPIVSKFRPRQHMES